MAKRPASEAIEGPHKLAPASKRARTEEVPRKPKRRNTTKRPGLRNASLLPSKALESSLVPGVKPTKRPASEAFEEEEEEQEEQEEQEEHTSSASSRYSKRLRREDGGPTELLCSPESIPDSPRREGSPSPDKPQRQSSEDIPWPGISSIPVSPQRERSPSPWPSISEDDPESEENTRKAALWEYWERQANEAFERSEQNSRQAQEAYIKFRQNRLPSPSPSDDSSGVDDSETDEFGYHPMMFGLENSDPRVKEVFGAEYARKIKEHMDQLDGRSQASPMRVPAGRRHLRLPPISPGPLEDVSEPEDARKIKEHMDQLDGVSLRSRASPRLVPAGSCHLRFPSISPGPLEDVSEPEDALSDIEIDQRPQNDSQHATRQRTRSFSASSQPWPSLSPSEHNDTNQTQISHALQSNRKSNRVAKARLQPSQRVTRQSRLNKVFYELDHSGKARLTTRGSG